MKVGAIVKPVTGPKTWRLGVVESIDGDRIKVRAYVAPPGAYEGSAATFGIDELAEVPRAEVEGALQVVRGTDRQRAATRAADRGGVGGERELTGPASISCGRAELALADGLGTH